MKQSLPIFFCSRFRYYMLLILLVFLTKSTELCSINSNALSELTVKLNALVNRYQNLPQLPQNKNSESEYLSDPKFFDQLLEKTLNPKLKAFLEEGVKKLYQLSAQGQKLAKYLLHFLFENKEFAQFYLNGGERPNYKYRLKDRYLYADYSTDLITRILLAVTIVNDIKDNWGLSNDIGLVSLGGGYLLQDFIIIKALNFSGYNKIRLSVIDPVNHTKDLEDIINNDRDLANVDIKHYADSYQFLSNSGQKERANNACYLVSPTGQGPSVISDAASLLHDRKINLFRIGEISQPNIRFYLPYDIKQSFAKGYGGDAIFLIHIIGIINKSMRSNIDLISALGKLEGPYSDLYGGDDIMLDFFDIIKNSSLKNCLGYLALWDKITEFKDIKQKPYWQFNYQVEQKSEDLNFCWFYEPKKNQFVQV